MPQYLALIDQKLLGLFGFQGSHLLSQNRERYYYLLRSDPHVRLTCWQNPLENIIGKKRVVLLGQETICGSLPGNQHILGEKGVTITVTDYKPRLKTRKIETLSNFVETKIIPGL